METVVQERELLLQMQGWPLQMMAPSLDASGGVGFLLGWEPPFGRFAADAHLHDLFPLCMETLPGSPELQDAALPEDLDDLLLSFWDASEEQQVAFNSTSPLPDTTTTTTTTTTSSSFLHDDDDPLGSIFSTGPTLAGQAVFQFQAPTEPLSCSSSSSHPDPRASELAEARRQDAPAPLPRSSSSLKRATPEGACPAISRHDTRVSEETEVCSQSNGKKRRKESAPASGCRRVVRPFALLKPDGLDGGATLADINARILMRPARPVRHPVGEFACAPRVFSADGPGISGKAITGFTRLHTPGRGTITIIRTRD